MSDQLVLAIEPDLRQAAIVKRIVREKVLADVAVVDSRDAAIEAMRTCMPDVLLLSALLSPRDEDELITHLKTLENAGHLQTHTIPQLASALQPGEERGRGLLSAFRRKKDPGPANGCDPDLFADEIRVFLKRAADKKRELLDSNHAAPDMRPSPAGTARAAAPETAAAAPQTSSWSSPFEWKPRAAASRNIPPNPSSLIADPESLIPDPVSLIPDPVSLVVDPESRIADPVSLIADPVSLIADPVSLIADPVSLIASPESLIASPEPPAAEFVSPIASREPLIPQPPFPISSTPLIPESHSLIADFAAPTVAAELAFPEPVSLVVESATSIPEPQVAVAEPTVVIPDPPAPIPAPPAPPPERRQRDSGFRDSGFRDSGFRDSGFRIRDSGSAIRDEGLVTLGFAPLGPWVRGDRNATEPADGPEDVRGLLSTLAVPSAIASVSYPRGCRIRRVRVPAIPDAESAETSGVVIASRGTAGEHRDRHPSV